MNKAKKYAVNGAIVGGIFNGLLNIFEQLYTKHPNEDFDWDELILDFGTGVVVGGGIGFTYGTIKDWQMSKIMEDAGDLSDYVEHVSESYEVTDFTLKQKAKQVRRDINEVFSHLLVKYPSLNGSIVKGTSIEGSDIDIVLNFSRYSGTIAEIFEEVNDYFRYEYDDVDLRKVRTQRCSVGLIFNADGEKKRIDIVPVRDTGKGTGDAYLNINDGSIFRKSTTIKKTNVSKQLSSLKFTAKQKELIRRIKILRKEHNLPIKPIHIEFLAKRAFEKVRLSRSADKSLFQILGYIGQNVTTARIVDPANSNNIISDIIDMNEKEQVRDFCTKMIKEVAKDERNIIDYLSS